jgi:signal transduction histidine kinase
MRWLSRPNPDLAKASMSLEQLILDGQRAGDAVQRIRQLFRRGAVEKVPVDLHQIIRETIRLVVGGGGRFHAVIASDLSPGAASVVGDRLQLQQVLLNLIHNGIDAMRSVADPQRRIVVRSTVADDEVVVRVRDHGTGMKDPERAFDAFYTTKEHGLGMGLAICRSIIDAHGGRLWVDAEEQPGTTMCFALPRPASAV